MTDYVTLDSGERQDYDSGMRRDTQQGKPRYDLIDRDFLRRWAELMARGAEKYGERNWELANSEEEVNRFKASAFRHLMQWLDGDETEDHAAAVAFNLAAAERTKGKTQEALEDGYYTLNQVRESLRVPPITWPLIGSHVETDNLEPDRAGVYRDGDGDFWSYRKDRESWCYALATDPEDWCSARKDWKGVVAYNKVTFPWVRIS